MLPFYAPWNHKKNRDNLFLEGIEREHSARNYIHWLILSSGFPRNPKVSSKNSSGGTSVLSNLHYIHLWLTLLLNYWWMNLFLIQKQSCTKLFFIFFNETISTCLVKKDSSYGNPFTANVPPCRSSHQRFSIKNALLNISQKSQENTCQSFFFIKVAAHTCFKIFKDIFYRTSLGDCLYLYFSAFQNFADLQNTVM